MKHVGVIANKPVFGNFMWLMTLFLLTKVKSCFGGEFELCENEWSEEGEIWFGFGWALTTTVY